MFGLISSVVGDVGADKVYHDFKRAKRQISSTLAKNMNSEEQLKEKHKQKLEQQLKKLQMQQKLLDSQFEKIDIDNQPQLVDIVKKSAPINLHSTCLMLKCFKKLILML